MHSPFVLHSFSTFSSSSSPSQLMPYLMFSLQLNDAKARREIGYKNVISIEDGLKEMKDLI